MSKFMKSNSQSGSPSSTRSSFFKRLSYNSSQQIPANKENLFSRQSYSMEFPLSVEEECSPSKLTIARRTSRERFPLEDQDPNSQDSGYSNSSSLFFEDSRSSSNFRFAEPNGVPPRRNNAVEFSPNNDLSPLGKRSWSCYPKQMFDSSSTSSNFSDFVDDGFSEHSLLPTFESSLMDHDENAQLPADVSLLLSCPIVRSNKITVSPTHSERSFLQTNWRRSLTENVITNRSAERSTEFELNQLILENDKNRTTLEEDGGLFLKRRKPNSSLKSIDRGILDSGLVTASSSMSNRETIFNHECEKTCVKFHRSLSEIETNAIKNAVQIATSNPHWIGDFSKPFALPLQIGKHTDLKNIDCHTLVKLINGEYNDEILSYSIIDCRYPYEYDGGHIKGAINLHTEGQILEELNSKKYLRRMDETSVENKRNILIFHCEFSSERGPHLLRYLRNQDRRKNFVHYPKLDYPEMYLLVGGYSNFFFHHKELCDPCGYRPMIDPKFSDEYKKYKRSKSVTSFGENRNSSLKRSGS